MKAFFLVIAAGAMLAVQGAANAAPGDTVYAQPGRLVPANGTRLNFYCMGSGSPAVVFDSGWEDWSPAWAVVQPQVAKWTRACSYDRAGAGFSEPGPMPRTSVRIADELHDALHNAGIEGPYPGGPRLRRRQRAHLCRPLHGGRCRDGAGRGRPWRCRARRDSGKGPPRAEGHHRRPARVPRCRCRGQAPAAAALAPAGQPARTCAQQFFRGLPEAVWSPELNAALLQLAQHKVAMYDAYISEMEEVPADELTLQQNRRSFGARPVRVITTGNHAVGEIGSRPTSLAHLKYEYDMAVAQARWLDLSSSAEAGVHAQQLRIRPVRRAPPRWSTPSARCSTSRGSLGGASPAKARSARGPRCPRARRAGRPRTWRR